MASGVIRMTYQETENTAQKFREASEQVTKLIADIQSAVSTMGSGWVGQAYTAMQRNQEQIEPTLKKFSTACDTIGEQLTKVASQFQNDDQSIGSGYNKA